MDDDASALRAQRRRVGPLVGLVVFLLLVAFVVWYRQGQEIDFSSYALVEDAPNVVLLVTQYGVTAPRAEVREGPDSVEVSLKVRRFTGRYLDSDAAYFEIRLEEPLGDRILIDMYDDEPVALEGSN